MSERQKQLNFLKLLIRSEDSEQRRDLQDRIKKAEQDERCIRRMMFLVVVVGLLSLACLGYSAVFHPNFFAHTMPFLVRLFSALTLGSLICLLVFVGYWFWQRNMLNGLNEECRRAVLAAMQAHSAHSIADSSAEHLHLVGLEAVTSPSNNQTASLMAGKPSDPAGLQRP